MLMSKIINDQSNSDPIIDGVLTVGNQYDSTLEIGEMDN